MECSLFNPAQHARAAAAKQLGMLENHLEDALIFEGHCPEGMDLHPFAHPSESSDAISVPIAIYGDDQLFNVLPFEI